MNSNDRALRAVRVQVQFELAEVAAQVASAAAIRADLQRRAGDLVKRSEATSNELRGALQRKPMNPALLVTIHQMCHREREELQAARAQAAKAQQREEQARDRLASVRNRDRSLERALQAERRTQELKAQAVEIGRADDSWLHHLCREER